MLAFGFAVFFLIITPGPAVLSLAGVGASFSFNSGLKFLTGLAIGHIAVSILVITGIASVIFLRFVVFLAEFFYICRNHWPKCGKSLIIAGRRYMFEK